VTTTASLPVTAGRWWTPVALFLAGASLVALAAVGWFVVALTQVGGWSWPDEEVVRVDDGTAHTVAVDAGRDTLLWSGGGTPQCTVADGATGLSLEPAGGRYVRPGGADEWTGFATFTPVSSSVAVTCAGAPQTLVAVEATPRVPAALAGYPVTMLVPAGLLLAGGLVLVASALTLARGLRTARSRTR
jgi:hypothetical protein